MAILKESTFPAIGLDGEPLVRLLSDLPSEAGLEKTAGIHPEILSYKQQLEPEPGKTYVHILALGAGDYYGANLNNDHFPWEGLQHDHTKVAHPYMHGYKTFLNAHAFAHHVNKDPEKAYGDVLVSVLNHKMKRVELIVAIDEEKCIKNGGQRTLEKIKAGEYPSTSMGCRVPFDVCSICGHKAKYRSEYCDHMRNDAGKIMADGRKVFVYNPYPRFFDISFVFIGADRTSFVLEKVANLSQLGNVGRQIGEKAVEGLTLRGMASHALKPVGDAIGRGVSRGGAHVAKGAKAVANARGVTGAVGGGLVGGISGAITAKDDARDIGFMKGLAGGALLGGVGNKFLRSSNALTGVANVGAMGATGAALANAALPTMPAQTSSLQGTEKVASNTMMGKALRKSSGTVQPYMGMRVKRKVKSQPTLTVRPLTFSKLKQSAKKNSAARLEAIAFDPLPNITFDLPLDKKEGPMSYGFGVSRINDAAIDKVAQLKSATVTKVSDIFKDVDASPMGRAVPLSVGSDPDMSCGELDSLAGGSDLGRSLSGLASAGIVLKPKEFQRVVLVRSGLHDMANDLGNRGIVFPERAPVVRSARIVIKGNPGHTVPSGVLDVIKNVLTRRSSLTPLALRRSPTPMPTVRVIRVGLGENPLLDKIASLYNGYREDVLLNTENMIKSAMLTPAIMSVIRDVRGFHDPNGPAFEAMAQLPLAYFSHAYWDRCCCDTNMSDFEFAQKFTEENPQIARYLAQQVAASCAMQ